MSSGKEDDTVSDVLYAASDVYLVIVVVALLLALDRIHHRTVGPRDQFQRHTAAPRELPGLTRQL